MTFRTALAAPLLLPLLLLLLLLSPPTARAATAAQVIRPDCPSQCGGIDIPYPFGLSENCSLSPDFKLTCSNDSAYLPTYELQNILVSQAKVRILKVSNRRCNSSWQPYNVAQTGTPFTVSPSANEFVVVGCDVIAILAGIFTGGSYDTGCIASCKGADAGNLMKDGSCDGIGCCRTSMRFNVFNYSTAIKGFDGTDISNMTNDGSTCARTFIVEKGNYSFLREDLNFTVDALRYPVIMDWGIGNQTCEDARKNTTSYACRSAQSECLSSATGVGYVCNCSSGYEGNPYLENGCQDIDECKDTTTYPCFGVCRNTVGSYECSCPSGTSGDPRFIGGCINGKNSTNTTKLILIVLGSSLGVLLILVCIFLFYRRLKKKRMEQVKMKHFQCNYDMLMTQQKLVCPHETANMASKVRLFSLKEIEKATSNFDDSHVVGVGGHGTVYKGLIDLRVVAIKKSKITTQSEITGFLNEIILLSLIGHRNIVKLVGCCLESEVPLLIYEFISNGTLSDHLHVLNRENPMLWDDRLRIAVEISGSLAYLHSSANISIFHRDIKSSNILLDEKLTAKLSDFGASKFVEMEQTHVSTNIQGTFGYLDPEYMHTGQLTDKSDVYSLGVILVELLTGEKPTSRMRNQEDRNLVSYFIWAFNQGKLFEVVEAQITSDAHREEIEMVAGLAVECLSFTGAKRPTMKDVEVILEGLRKNRKGKKKQPKSDEGSLPVPSSFHASNGDWSMSTNEGTITMSTTSERPHVLPETLMR